MKKKIFAVFIIGIFVYIALFNATEVMFAADTQPLPITSLKKHGIQAYDNKEYEMAETYFNMAWKQAPKDINILYYLSSIYIKLKRYNKAAEFALAALKIDPDSDYGHMYMGKAYMGLKQYKKAITSFQKSNRTGEFSGNYIDIGWCYYYLGNYKMAVMAFKKANTIEKYVLTYIGIGRSLYKLKDYEGSIKSFEEAAKLDKNKTWDMAIKINTAITRDAMEINKIDIASIEDTFVLGLNLEKHGDFFRVQNVKKGMLGDTAGILQGDILIEFDGKSLKGIELPELISLINNSSAFKDARLKIMRGNDIQVKVFKGIVKGE